MAPLCYWLLHTLCYLRVTHSVLLCLLHTLCYLRVTHSVLLCLLHTLCYCVLLYVTHSATVCHTLCVWGCYCVLHILCHYVLLCVTVCDTLCVTVCYTVSALTKKRITLFDKKITTQKKSKLAHLRLLSKSNRLWIPMITFYKRNQNWRTFDYFQKVIVCESQWLLFIKEIKIGAPSITFKK